MNQPSPRTPRRGRLRYALAHAALVPLVLLAVGCSKKSVPPADSAATASASTNGAASPQSAPEKVFPKPAQPLTEPYYPPESRRAGEAGTVELSLHVLSSGAIDDVAIAKSSGHPALDEYAVREARTRWRMEPGMEHGKPVAMWHNFRVKYKIAD